MSLAELPPIHGVAPGSKEEYFVSIALEKFGWGFDYQVAFFGGKAVRGGQVVDFLVDTAPRRTPLQVYGEYWHGTLNAEKDRWQQILFASEYHGQFADAVIVMGSEVSTPELAEDTILKYFGRAQ